MYINILDKIKSSEFAKNIIIIFSGSVASQILPILFMPILTRIYEPEAYGIFGLYVSIGAITAVFSTLRYSQAIQITEQNEEAFLILKFCIFLVISFSFFLFLILIPIYLFYLSNFKIESIGVTILSLPLYVFSLGITEVLLIWINRNKKFKYITFNKILTTSLSIMITFIWALTVNKTFNGLISGIVIAQMIGAGLLLYRTNQMQKFDLTYNKNLLKRLIIKFKYFPIYSLPSDLINVVTNQLPILMLNNYATSKEVGYFNMSNRLLGLPSQLISKSVGEVFRQRATQDYLIKGTCLPIFNNTFKTLVLLGIIPFISIAFFGSWLFTFFLGNEWTEAGQYSQIFAVMFFLRFTISPLTYTFYITGKQKMDLYGHILMLISTLIPFYLGFSLFKNLYLSLILYSISYSIIYIFYYYYSKKYTKQ